MSTITINAAVVFFITVFSSIAFSSPLSSSYRANDIQQANHQRSSGYLPSSGISEEGLQTNPVIDDVSIRPYYPLTSHSHLESRHYPASLSDRQINPRPSRDGEFQSNQFYLDPNHPGRTDSTSLHHPSSSSSHSASKSYPYSSSSHHSQNNHHHNHHHQQEQHRDNPHLTNRIYVAEETGEEQNVFKDLSLRVPEQDRPDSWTPERQDSMTSGFFRSLRSLFNFGSPSFKSDFPMSEKGKQYDAENNSNSNYLMAPSVSPIPSTPPGILIHELDDAGYPPHEMLQRHSNRRRAHIDDDRNIGRKDNDDPKSFSQGNLPHDFNEFHQRQQQWLSSVSVPPASSDRHKNLSPRQLQSSRYYDDDQELPRRQQRQSREQMQQREDFEQQVPQNQQTRQSWWGSRNEQTPPLLSTVPAEAQRFDTSEISVDNGAVRRESSFSHGKRREESDSASMNMNSAMSNDKEHRGKKESLTFPDDFEEGNEKPMSEPLSKSEAQDMVRLFRRFFETLDLTMGTRSPRSASSKNDDILREILHGNDYPEFETSHNVRAALPGPQWNQRSLGLDSEQIQSQDEMISGQDRIADDIAVERAEATAARASSLVEAQGVHQLNGDRNSKSGEGKERNERATSWNENKNDVAIEGLPTSSPAYGTRKRLLQKKSNQPLSEVYNKISSVVW